MRTVLYASVVIMALGGASQRPTIPETIKRIAPNPLYSAKVSEIPLRPLAELAKAADLIVRATIAPIATNLSLDQRDLYTDYAVTPIRVIAQRITVNPEPGRFARVVLTKWGGTTVVEGTMVTLRNLDMPDFSAGEEAFLFLTLETDGRFVLTGLIGAFPIKANIIQPRHANHERYRGRSADQFEAEVRGAL